MDRFGALSVWILAKTERIKPTDLQDQRRSVQKVEKGGNMVDWQDYEEDYEPVTIWSYIGLIWLATAVVGMVFGLIWIAV